MPKLIKPERLRSGDVIGIVAPASPMEAALLEKGVRYLEKLGYRTKIGRHVFGTNGYLAGTDRQRAQDLNAMFKDRRVKAIFCARGGYGTPRLLSLLDYDAIARNPKIFVGYSDITALQLAMLKKAGLVTFSGPMVAAEMGRGIHPFTEARFWQTITEPVAPGSLGDMQEHPLRGFSRGKAKGRLVGGCLSLVTALFGSPYLPSMANKILFVEEIGEEIYRLDRQFNQMRHSGIFDKINGFVLGQLLDCDPDDDKPSLSIDDLLEEYIKPLKIPAASNLAYGHGQYKHTIPLGIRAELQIHPRVSHLSITEPAVC